VKAPKNVYPETAMVLMEILLIVPNGFSNHVSALNVLSTPTVDLVQTIHFVAGALKATLALKLTTTEPSTENVMK